MRVCVVSALCDACPPSNVCVGMSAVVLKLMRDCASSLAARKAPRVSAGMCDGVIDDLNTALCDVMSMFELMKLRSLNRSFHRFISDSRFYDEYVYILFSISCLRVFACN